LVERGVGLRGLLPGGGKVGLIRSRPASGNGSSRVVWLVVGDLFVQNSIIGLIVGIRGSVPRIGHGLIGGLIGLVLPLDKVAGRRGEVPVHAAIGLRLSFRLRICRLCLGLGLCVCCGNCIGKLRICHVRIVRRIWIGVDAVGNRKAEPLKPLSRFGGSSREPCRRSFCR